MLRSRFTFLACWFRPAPQLPWVSRCQQQSSLHVLAVLQYGHGLFGSRSQVKDAYLGEQANLHGYLLGATDWLGLSSADVVCERMRSVVICVVSLPSR